MQNENTTSITPTSASKLVPLKKSRFLAQLEQLKQEVLDNPSLPAKLAKQRINSLKQQQELVLRELAAPAVAEVLAKALQMALSGDRRMIELILSMHISKPQAAEEQDSARQQVQILIQNLTKPDPVEVKVIDLTPEESENSE